MKQIVVISGKGGTGKTIITAAFASLAKNKVMADCDVDAADLHLLLDPKISERHEFKGGKTASIHSDKCDRSRKCIQVCRFDAIVEFSANNGYSKTAIDPISCDGCGICSYVCPRDAIMMKENIAGEWFISDTKYGPFVHAKLGIAEENSGKLVAVVRQHARLIAEKENLDFVIIDGSPGTGCPVISSISGMDCALVVTEPTLSGLHDMVRVIELTRHFRVKTFVVVNKYDLNTEMTDEIEGYCLKNGVNLAGKISYDPEIIKAMVDKKIITEYSDREVSKQIKKVWGIIQNELN